MHLLFGLLFGISTLFSAQGDHDTDHYVYNGTEATIVISVDYKDQANNPSQGSAMYSIPSGTAMVIGQLTAQTDFVEPTSYFTFTILSGDTGTDPNKKESWTLEKISDTKARYQCIL